MESHEWNENTEEGKRYYRANYQGGRQGSKSGRHDSKDNLQESNWTILTTLQKRDPKWDFVDEPTLEMWQEVREIVWKKYQRKRCPWERVVELDKIIEGLNG